MKQKTKRRFSLLVAAYVFALSGCQPQPWANFTEIWEKWTFRNDSSFTVYLAIGNEESSPLLRGQSRDSGEFMGNWPTFTYTPTDRVTYRKSDQYDPAGYFTLVSFVDR